jgi:hypothetical protein
MSLGNPDDLTPEVNVTNDDPEGKTVVTATLKNGNVTTTTFSTASSNSDASKTPIATASSAPKAASVIPLSEFQSFPGDPMPGVKGGAVPPVGKSGNKVQNGKRFNLARAILLALLAVISFVFFFFMVFGIGLNEDSGWIFAFAFTALFLGVIGLIEFIKELKRPRI